MKMTLTCPKKNNSLTQKYVTKLFLDQELYYYSLLCCSSHMSTCLIFSEKKKKMFTKDVKYSLLRLVF